SGLPNMVRGHPILAVSRRPKRLVMPWWTCSCGGDRMIQAALNGSRRCDAPAGLPCSADQLARGAAGCVAAGASAIHLHPRDAAGLETLDPLTIFAVCRQVKEAARVPVGVSTGAWIEPDLEKRLALVRSWYGPDYASVNCSEDGA